MKYLLNASLDSGIRATLRCLIGIYLLPDCILNVTILFMSIAGLELVSLNAICTFFGLELDRLPN